MSSLYKYMLLCLIFPYITGCNAGYVLRAAYEEAKILAAREPITDILEQQSVDKDQREKLSLVLEARSFAKQIGLTPGGAYTSFSKVDRDILAWIVMASQRDSFQLYTRWFPIVGTVPYRGFFQKEKAEGFANNLEKKGYETWVRGTDAFSTLGWFDDPILSTTLHHHPVTIVNTVIHESVHATKWISGNVPFNESLGNFIGIEATVKFFEQKLRKCTFPVLQCTKELEYLRTAQRQRNIEYELATVLEKIFHSLSTLYSSNISSEEKILQREEIFQKEIAHFAKRYPKRKVLLKLNNAEVMQLYIYRQYLKNMQEKFENLQSPSFQQLLEKIKPEA